MAKSNYFENFENSSEQTLIEDLIVESIKIYGINVYYLSRKVGAEDKILNEDDLSEFNSAYLVETYIQSVDGFGGDGDFLSKFGLEIRDSMTLTIAQRTFDIEVGLYTEEIRPKEGDVIYFPLNGKFFEVQHVEHEAIFYQMGSLQTYDLRVELFEHSGETFNTGIEQIDARYDKYNISSNTAVANIDSVDSFADNDPFEQEGDLVLNFDENNPYGEQEY